MLGGAAIRAFMPTGLSPGATLSCGLIHRPTFKMGAGCAVTRVVRFKAISELCFFRF